MHTDIVLERLNTWAFLGSGFKIALSFRNKFEQNGLVLLVTLINADVVRLIEEKLPDRETKGFIECLRKSLAVFTRDCVFPNIEYCDIVEIKSISHKNKLRQIKFGITYTSTSTGVQFDGHIPYCVLKDIDQIKNNIKVCYGSINCAKEEKMKWGTPLCR